jgi:hypothetical protein
MTEIQNFFFHPSSNDFLPSRLADVTNLPYKTTLLWQKGWSYKAGIIVIECLPLFEIFAFHFLIPLRSSQNFLQIVYIS